MAANDIFEIEVLNWEKHKGGFKPNHHYFPVHRRIFDDHKVATLTPVERLLFITILARCADDYASTVRPTHHQLATACGLHRHDIARSLASLESNQLIRVKKLPPKTIQNNTKQKKTKQNKAREVEKPETASRQAAVAAVPIGKLLIGSYCEAFKARYKTNPVIRPQDARALKNFGESVGLAKGRDLLAAYLTMNNSWFITKAHDLTTFLQNLNQVQNFVATGQVVTLADARNAEASNSLANQVKRLTEGVG